MALARRITPVRVVATAVVLGLAAGSGVAHGEAVSAPPSVERASAEYSPHARARIQVVNPIRVGTVVRITMSGFAPRALISAAIQPKSAQGANGVGRGLFRERRANASGVLVVRMRFPRSYFICAGSQDCGTYLFKNGERVLISAYDSSKYASATRRLVVPARR